MPRDQKRNKKTWRNYNMNLRPPHTPWILENLNIVTDSIGVYGEDVTQSQVAIDYQYSNYVPRKAGSK